MKFHKLKTTKSQTIYIYLIISIICAIIYSIAFNYNELYLIQTQYSDIYFVNFVTCFYKNKCLQ